ncbi:unnamed protein product [Urochloa decumbens]|uniref:Glutamine amidotransferase domain-containing protein n=1 Tax=Urochloa decumbens TaxID=240449 RepID=A0ABC9EM43_9POAL
MTAAARPARRYALLLALWDSDYARKVYGGYHNVFVSAFGTGGAGERWDCFRVIAGEFPAAEDLATYDGFVVSGSPHDAHGDEPWIRRLCALVRTLHAMGKRVLGVCFGHQLLCRALGGRVGRARGGWDVGVRTVTFAPGLMDQGRGRGLGFLAGVGSEFPRSAAIVEVHRDEVWELPPGATVLASSEKTRVEAFAVGDTALGVQGHPEYTADILLNLVDRLTSQGDIGARAGEEARRKAAEAGGGPDRAFWTGLCRNFLSGGGGSGVVVSSTRPMTEVAGGGCFAGTASIAA